MAYQETSDANFFALVHSVLESQQYNPQERRSLARRPFACLQFIARYADGRLPSRQEFRKVLCRDLSPTGFSYLTAERPDSEYVIAALGALPYLFVAAAVVRVTPENFQGRPMFLVGCKFMSRIRDLDLGALGDMRSTHDLGNPPADATATGLNSAGRPPLG